MDGANDHRRDYIDKRIFGEGASTEHYALCRCGASRNKPFCDGSHWEANFQDPEGAAATTWIR